MSIFDSRLKYVTCKVWNATASDFVFPEVSDDNPEREALLSRKNAGICFSGGGTRSAAATLGQLRGLHEIGCLERVRYLSCVSGGAWAAVPFTYLPERWSDETFLGMVRSPEEISEDSLRNLDRNSFAYAIANSVLVDDLLKNAIQFAGDELYSRAIGDIFLNGFGLDSLKRFFAFNPGTLQATLARNPQARSDDFYLVRTGRPYLLVGGTLLRVSNAFPLPQQLHFEMTPFYTGVRPVYEGAGSAGQHIGGGYIESFGFDSDAPNNRRPNAAGEVRVRLGARRHRFTLPDVMGTTGAAPAEIFLQFGIDWAGFPEFKYWPMQVAPRRPRHAVEYEFGDGGILENLGLMPLLARKVEHIVIFVNTNHALKSPTGIADSLPPVFGQTEALCSTMSFPKRDTSPWSTRCASVKIRTRRSCIARPTRSLKMRTMASKAVGTSTFYGSTTTESSIGNANLNPTFEIKLALAPWAIFRTTTHSSKIRRR